MFLKLCFFLLIAPFATSWSYKTYRSQAVPVSPASPASPTSPPLASVPQTTVTETKTPQPILPQPLPPQPLPPQPLPPQPNNTYPDQELLASVFGPPGQGAYVSDISNSPVDLIDEVFKPSLLDYDRFDWTLTKRVASSTSDNFLISPLGLKLALAVLTEAATGATKSELESVLGFANEEAVVRQKFSTILDSLETKSSQYILNLGSKIYIENSADPQQRYASIAKAFYKTDISKIDFYQPTVAANEINAWVANISEGRIPKLVDPDDLNSLVVLLLNVIYFKGTWTHQFPPNATKNDKFYVTPKLTKVVPFMNVRDRFYYKQSEKLDANILRLPYKGGKFSLYVIVPNSLTGIGRIFSDLGLLRGEIDGVADTLVDVTMPRFQFDYLSLLDQELQSMGVRNAFENTASFPGIARGYKLQERLKISKVMQKTGIDVNEVGSVVFAATEVSLVNKFGEGDEVPKSMVLNRPFVFFIEDEATRQLLFTGQLCDPSQPDGHYNHAH